AFYFLEDYEKNRRSWIDEALLSVKITTSSVMSILNIFGLISNAYAVLICIFLFILSIVGFSRLRTLNKRKIAEVKDIRTRSRYTLSLRYQIMEN
ncbi:hypothetical protein PMAYCL1PPCAC_20188, partial [Pristionchus mayeri]